MPRILVVEDEPAIRLLFVEVLGDVGADVVGAKDMAEATRLFPTGFQVAVLDLRLPDGDGMVLVRRFRAADPACAIVVMSGHGTTEVELAARAAGATAFLHKPFLVDELVAQVEALLPADEALAIGV
jgi:two-component system, NtrC family, sensor histidine kinase HydH